MLGINAFIALALAPMVLGKTREALSDAMGKMDGAETGKGLPSLKSSGVTTQVRGSISLWKFEGQSSTVALKEGEQPSPGHTLKSRDLVALLCPQQIFY